MTVSAWIAMARVRLRASGCPDPRTDARLLMAGALGVEPGELLLMGNVEINAERRATLTERLARREAGEPLQYIEGAAYFMGLEFLVDERVLIPRPDTETLCEAALEKLRYFQAPAVLDLCTGSGALAVAISRARPDARVTASDISAGALSVARENARRNGAPVRFLMGDGLAPAFGERFHAIVCNPPYLSRADMECLQSEVRREPALALFGGENGLGAYTRIFSSLARHMEKGAVALFEVGAGQAADVMNMAKRSVRASDSGIVRDLGGIERVVWVRSE